MVYKILDTKIQVNKILKSENVLNDDIVVLVYSSSCGPCNAFLHTWNEMIKDVKKSDDKVYYKINVDVLSHIKEINPVFYDKIINKMFTNQPGVPNIAKYNYKTKKIIQFTQERLLNVLKKFVEIRRVKKI
jgi:thiol-disulfide isomerase/thioredoxin